MKHGSYIMDHKSNLFEIAVYVSLAFFNIKTKRSQQYFTNFVHGVK